MSGIAQGGTLMRTSYTIGHLLPLDTKRWSLRFVVASSVSTKLPAVINFRRRNSFPELGLRITASPAGRTTRLQIYKHAFELRSAKLQY
jgi:hypothetical protein